MAGLVRRESAGKPGAVQTRCDQVARLIEQEPLHCRQPGHFRPISTLLALVTVAWLIGTETQAAPLKTRNVFLIISDGLRWQEIFQGAEQRLLDKTNGSVRSLPALQQQFWRETPEERRQALFPFLWTEVAQRGQLFGNQKKGSIARVTNGRNFSYPGYNETFSGLADPRLNSNDKKPNPNLTVFEWLNGRPGFKNRVAIFGSWDVFPYIVNRERSGLTVWPAWETRFESKGYQPPGWINAMLEDGTPLWEELIPDSLLFHANLDYVKARQPRVCFVGYGETDEWAHEGHYDYYLYAAHHVDRFVRTLWNTVQAMPQYRNKTTFIITADHGRGGGLTDWKGHGEKVPGSDGLWIGILGPDTPPAGERAQASPVTQSQIAATIAAFLGEDFRAAVPQSAPPIADAFRRN